MGFQLEINEIFQYNSIVIRMWN